MNADLNRRQFLKRTGLAGAGLTILTGTARANSPNARVRVGIMGLNGRGMDRSEERRVGKECS